jgi:hypothetical protein
VSTSSENPDDPEIDVGDLEPEPDSKGLSSDSDSVPPQRLQEKRILEDIQKGIAFAVAENEHISDADAKFLGRVKIHKLAWLAVKRFDEPITRSWYLAGPYLKTGNISVGSVNEWISDAGKVSDEFIDGRNHKQIPKDAAKYVDFYVNEVDLHKIWYTKGGEFLKDFYETEAPDDYRDVYISSIELRNQLEIAISRVSKIIDGKSGETQLSLGNFGGSDITAPDYYKEIGLLVSNMHLALTRNDDLSATVPRFKQFSDLLEDVFMMLAETQVSNLDNQHLAILRRLRDFHYYAAWKLPALIVSRNTATGPGADELKQDAALELRDLNDGYDREIVDLESYCAERGLLPDYTDYPDRDDTEMQALVDELADRYIRG